MSTLPQNMLKMVDDMPAFPKSVHRILELTSDINCNPKELVQVIEHDPVLILKILKLVNSSYFGLAQKISSINHAVVYVGLNTIKNLALSTATIGMLPRKNKAGFDIDAFLLHSLSTAAIAKLLAKNMNVTGTDLFDFFLVGLLHDVGKIVFAQFMPEEFKKAMAKAKKYGVALRRAEKKIIGADHSEVGYMLGEKWQLAPSLTEAIRDHHFPGGYKGQVSVLTEYLFIANQVSKQKKIGFGGEEQVEPLPAALSKKMGMNLDEIIESLEDLESEVEKALLFVRM